MSISAAFPIAHQRKSAHAITAERVGGFEPSELAAAYDALRTAQQVLCGLSCQPRFHREGGRHNGAGELIAELMDHLVVSLEIVTDTARAAKVSKPCDVENRAWLLLSHEAAMGDRLSDIAALAAKFAAESASADAMAGYATSVAA